MSKEEGRVPTKDAANPRKEEPNEHTGSQDSAEVAGSPVRRFDWERQLRSAPDVHGSRMLTLLVVATFLGLDGSGYCGARQVADACGLSRSTVQRGLSWARQAGWITQTRRGHRVSNSVTVASEWRLSIPTQYATRDTLDNQGRTSDTLGEESQGSTDDTLGKANVSNERPNVSSERPNVSPGEPQGPSPQGPHQGPMGRGRSIDAPTASAGAPASDAEEVRRVVAELDWDEATAQTWVSGLRAKCRNTHGWAKFFETSLGNEASKRKPKPQNQRQKPTSPDDLPLPPGAIMII